MTLHRPFAIDLRYEVVTPLYLGGSDAEVPELRPASLRGAVRSWYRAIDPRFKEREGHWFGAAADGADERAGRPGPWRVRVVGSTLEPGFKLERSEYRRFDSGVPPMKTNGVLYTGYTLMDRFNARTGFYPSDARAVATFDVRLTVLPHLVRADDPADFYWALLGSHWLLGHLGALGSRARRGWGSVQLRSVTPAANSQAHLPPAVEPILAALGAARTTRAADWLADVHGVLTVLAERFPGTRAGASAQTPHLGRRRRVLVLQRGHTDWAGALDHVGADLQRFRRDQHRDREAVAQQLLNLDRPGAGQPLSHAPVRAAFGLPLTFRFALTPRRIRELGIERLRHDAIEFQPAEECDRKVLTRYPGPASLRVVRLDDGWHGAIVKLDGAPVGSPDPPKEEGGSVTASVKGNVLSGNRSVGRVPSDRDAALETIGRGIVDFWLDSLTKAAIEAPRPQ